MLRPPEYGEGVFPTTRWTLVERAADGRLAVRRQALGELLRLYWPALQAHLRRRGRVVPDRVDDLLQGFICDKVVEDSLLDGCRRDGGKFRTFLLTTLDRYLVDQYRRDIAARRAPDRAATGSEAGRAIDAEAASRADPVAEFDAASARQAVLEAVRRTRETCERSSRTDIWHVLHGRLLAPLLDGAAVVTYDELADRFRLDGADSAANLLVTGKRMFQRTLREVVRLYCADDREVADEVRELRRILSGPGVGR